MGFVERKCKILTLKVRYTFFAGHPVDNTKIKENNSAKKKKKAYQYWILYGPLLKLAV